MSNQALVLRKVTFYPE